MTRRRASTATLFSQQIEERRVQSHRFSGRLAYGEGISERNPASKIDQHRRRSTSGRCWAAADRSPRRWHCLRAQAFVFLAKDKGDSLRVAPLADEKKVRSFTACDDVHAWWPDSGGGAERQWTTLSQLVWQDTDLMHDHSPEVLHFGPVLNVQHESLGKYRWCSRSLTIDLLQTWATSVWQGIISGWIQWVKHACTSCTPYRRTGRECMWIWLWTASFGLGSQWGTVSNIQNTNKPHGAGEEQDSKLGNSLTLAFFGIKACDWEQSFSAGSGADD